MAVCRDEAIMEAFVTMATNDDYALGALVLGHSLKAVQTTRQLVVLTTSSVSTAMREQLNNVFDMIKMVDLLDSHDATNLELLSRPELGVTLTKIHCWRLTQFTKCVFLDADTLVLRNIDDLFDREEFSAAPDAGWPDCFNSGVFVFRPCDETYNALLQCMNRQGSFDGGDQGLLNSYFNDWATKDIAKHLPFVYNVVTQTFYSYLPALKQFGKDIRVVHFIGSQKPWHISRESILSSGTDEPSGDVGQGHFIRTWWEIFSKKLEPPLLQSKELICGHDESTIQPDSNVATIVSDSVQTSDAKSTEDAVLADPKRQYDWEKGQIDYMGMDRFENILKQLDEKINGGDANKATETKVEAKRLH